MRVDVQIHHTDVEGDFTAIDGLLLVCKRCGLEVEVAGTSGASARRGAVKLRDGCLSDEQNYYDVDFWD
jgi:hypothetical protein